MPTAATFHSRPIAATPFAWPSMANCRTISLPSVSTPEHPTIAEFPPVPITQRNAADCAGCRLATSPGDRHRLRPMRLNCSSPAMPRSAAAITALWQQSVSGAEKPAGDYFVAYALDFHGLAMPLGGAKLHLKNLSAFTGKDNVRLDAPGPRFAYRPPHSRPQAAGQPHRRRWQTLWPRRVASRSAIPGSTHYGAQMPASPARVSILCAFTLMPLASAAGDGRVIVSRRLPMSNSTMSR